MKFFISKLTLFMLFSSSLLQAWDWSQVPPNVITAGITTTILTAGGVLIAAGKYIKDFQTKKAQLKSEEEQYKGYYITVSKLETKITQAQEKYTRLFELINKNSSTEEWHQALGEKSIEELKNQLEREKEEIDKLTNALEAQKKYWEEKDPLQVNQFIDSTTQGALEFHNNLQKVLKKITDHEPQLKALHTLHYLSKYEPLAILEKNISNEQKIQEFIQYASVVPYGLVKLGEEIDSHHQEIRRQLYELHFIDGMSRADELIKQAKEKKQALEKLKALLKNPIQEESERQKESARKDALAQAERDREEAERVAEVRLKIAEENRTLWLLNQKREQVLEEERQKTAQVTLNWQTQKSREEQNKYTVDAKVIEMTQALNEQAQRANYLNTELQKKLEEKALQLSQIEKKLQHVSQELEKCKKELENTQQTLKNAEDNNAFLKTYTRQTYYALNQWEDELQIIKSQISTLPINKELIPPEIKEWNDLVVKKIENLKQKISNLKNN
jgi:hypothetical protein